MEENKLHLNLPSPGLQKHHRLPAQSEGLEHSVLRARLRRFFRRLVPVRTTLSSNLWMDKIHFAPRNPHLKGLVRGFLRCEMESFIRSMVANKFDLSVELE